MYLFVELAKRLSVPEQYYVLFAILVIVLAVIVALLKGLALWRSGRNGQTVWFWVLVFVNTIGILEIIYLLTNKDKDAKAKVSPSVPAGPQMPQM